MERILRSADFVRVMATAPHAKSRHFVLHHLADVPSQAFKPKSDRLGLIVDTLAHGEPVAQATDQQLSTSVNPNLAALVDDSGSTRGKTALPPSIWLGMVVPKRHAKRSVTRSLIKRQMRAVFCLQQQHQALSFGLWVLRLRAAFDPNSFHSAASAPLALAVRQELMTLLAQAASAPSNIPTNARTSRFSPNRHPAFAK